MKPRILTRKSAARDSTRYIDRYLGEIINYGGEPCTRAEVILDMQQLGLDQPCIDRWLQGYEHAQRLRERRAQITTRLYLQTDIR